MSWYSYPNRTLCQVLDELRKYTTKVGNTWGTANTAYLVSCLEEIQTYANRMESALEDWSDIRHLQKECSKLRKQKKKLAEQVEKLEQRIEEAEDASNTS